MQRKWMLAGLFLLVPGLLWAGEANDTRPAQDLHHFKGGTVAFVGADVVVSPESTLHNATLIVKDGVVAELGMNLDVPGGAVKIDMKGKRLYPGFIEMYSHYGMPAESKSPEHKGGLTPEKNGTGHWSSYIMPERDAGARFAHKQSDAAPLRGQGFTVVTSFLSDGIMRGTGLSVLLADESDALTVLDRGRLQSIQFIWSGWKTFVYPISQMGTMALLRQTFSDALWYAEAEKIAKPGELEANQGLTALAPFVREGGALIFEVKDEHQALRVARLAREFNLNYLIAGEGAAYAYRRASEFAAHEARLVIPLKFPEKPDVTTHDKASAYSLRQLKAFVMAPDGPRILDDAGLPFAFSTYGLKNKQEFWKNLRTIVAHGLPKEKALAALTTQPATWLGLAQRIGRLQPGYLANIVVADGDLFEKETSILETWVAGRPYDVAKRPPHDPRGKWLMTVHTPQKTADLLLEGKPGSLSGSLTLDGEVRKLDQVAIHGLQLAFSCSIAVEGFKRQVRFAAVLDGDSMTGTSVWPDGWVSGWDAVLQERGAGEQDKKDADEKEENKEDEPLALTLVYPDGAFGREQMPEQPESLLVKGATVWTAASSGILEQADLLVQAGKIVAVGQNLSAPSGSTQVIDATGKHITPGLIDGHSHIAMSSVNEPAFANTAMVRAGDVIDPDSVHIYRQLAGGVTMANLLHGSSNPIGGQNAVIKLRWGQGADELRYEHAKPGIKFALGENVRQVNYGNGFTKRYPKSRLGVEAFFRDAFLAAKDYRSAWDNFKGGGTALPPRRDFCMEALVDILEGKRQIHCHSYRQDEILALMRVAEDMGFKVDVFTHILEGYKVADAMARHGAMASTFSDWWAYKIEVFDAIPYNAALLHGQGVVTAFNSDSAELARHLNLEAAKVIKYGGLSREEAIKFVTINAARQLAVEAKTGSLEAGKEADFVIWSGDPLSVYSRCEQTWIDGRRYFDLDEDRELRQQASSLRHRLIQYILNDGNHPADENTAEPEKEPEFGCMTIAEEVGR